MMTKRDYQRRAFKNLRVKKEIALKSSEYNISCGYITIHEIEGFIECLFDMDIITTNTYHVLNSWKRSLAEYIENNYEW